MAAMPPVLPYLPSDLILSHLLPKLITLPTKWICRFRCVCKAWNSFLSTPTFARSHLRYQTKYKILLPDHTTQTFRTFTRGKTPHKDNNHSIPFGEDVSILASLDGLLCVSLKKSRMLAFWNPLTGVYKKFRLLIDIDNNDGFAFYKDSSNDYKLLHIRGGSAFIYSGILDTWRKIPSLKNTIYSIINSFGTFLGGKVYLTASSPGDSDNMCVISFNVELEKFKEIDCPMYIRFDWGVNLVVLNHCLHVGVAYISEYVMWRMDGDQEWISPLTFDATFRRWFRKYSTEDYTSPRKLQDSRFWFKNEDDMEDFLRSYYDSSDNDKWVSKGGITFIETLISPHP